MMSVLERILSNEAFADVALVCGQTDTQAAASIKEQINPNFKESEATI